MSGGVLGGILNLDFVISAYGSISNVNTSLDWGFCTNNVFLNGYEIRGLASGTSS